MPANKIKQEFDKALNTELGLNSMSVTDYYKESEMKEVKTKQRLKGGISDNLTLNDIAKKHKVDLKDIEKELSIGMKVEKEHTSDNKRAKEIAMDHLTEDPKYYQKLKKMENKEEWSKKYKDSIDCKNPKGFSQRAHCQGKKKKSENKEATGAASAGGYSQPLFGTIKKETKEATGAASSGSYETPRMWAKSTSKKDWRGKSKTQIPGGKFVQVKKKCKTFPYCNQGDINALNLSESEMLKRVIRNVSKKTNISESTIITILTEYMN